jgi:membrane protein implicated in regulation of membrane protease activity
VRLRGELWRAELNDGSPTVPRGGEVVVDEVDGLTLRVRPRNG